MVRASNPKLMVRVLDAVTNLGDSRGSSAREVLSFIRLGNVSSKNLTLQVHRALKNAVNAGLLRHKSGRYKVLATLNPASDSPVSPVDKEPASGGHRKTNDKTPKSDAPSTAARIGSTAIPRRKQEPKKKTTSQRQSNKPRGSGTRRRTRSSPHKRTTNTTGQSRKRRQRKRSYEEDEYEDQSAGRYVSTCNRDAESSFDRRTKRPRLSRRESDSSDDESDRESYVSRKRVSRANKSSRREKPKEATRAKSRDRSASRARSPQRNVQARQCPPIEETGNDNGRRQHDENRGSAERDAARKEAREDVEGCAREPNDSNSGSTLENS